MSSNSSEIDSNNRVMGAVRGFFDYLFNNKKLVAAQEAKESKKEKKDKKEKYTESKERRLAELIEKLDELDNTLEVQYGFSSELLTSFESAEGKFLDKIKDSENKKALDKFEEFVKGNLALFQNSGDKRINFLLADLYSDGLGVEKSDVNAYSHYFLAAKAGHNGASKHLFEKGTEYCCEGDEERAEKYFRAALSIPDVGYVRDTAYEIYKVYSEGKKTDINIPLAGRYLCKAIARYHKLSQSDEDILVKEESDITGLDRDDLGGLIFCVRDFIFPPVFFGKLFELNKEKLCLSDMQEIRECYLKYVLKKEVDPRGVKTSVDHLLRDDEVVKSDEAVKVISTSIEERIKLKEVRKNIPPNRVATLSCFSNLCRSGKSSNSVSPTQN